MFQIRCVNCSVPLGNEKVIINGSAYCKECANLLGLTKEVFAMFEELQMPVMRDIGLDFANSMNECPKCKRSLKELESGENLGCVECYNKFREVINKSLLKNQATTEYKGRNPGELKLIAIDDEEVSIDSEPIEEVKDERDITQLSDSELKEKMEAAIAVENYKLAAEIRDELKKRQGGN